MDKRTGMALGLLMGLGAAMLPQSALAQHHSGGHGGGHGGGIDGSGLGGFGHGAVWGHGGSGGHHIRHHHGQGLGATPFIAGAAGLGAYGLYASSYYPGGYGYGYGYVPAALGYGRAPACSIERQWVRHGLHRAWVETCY